MISLCDPLGRTDYITWMLVSLHRLFCLYGSSICLSSFFLFMLAKAGLVPKYGRSYYNNALKLVSVATNNNNTSLATNCVISN